MPKPGDLSVNANRAGNERIVLMGHEDLKSADYLGQRNRFVVPPILYSLSIIHHDDEILLLALVVDFRLRAVSTRHLDEWAGDESVVDLVGVV